MFIVYRDIALKNRDIILRPYRTAHCKLSIVWTVGWIIDKTSHGENSMQIIQ